MQQSAGGSAATDPRHARLIADAFDRSELLVLLVQLAVGDKGGLRILTANGAFARLCDYKCQDLPGVDFLETFCTGAASGARAELLQALLEGREHECELPFARRDGQALLLGLRFIPTGDDSAASRPFAVMGRDITAIRIEARRGEATRGLLTNVFKVIDIAVAIVSEAGDVLLANPRCSDLLGWNHGELEGRPALDLVALACRSDVLAARQLQLVTNQDFDLRIRLQRKDGSEVGVFYHSSAVQRPDQVRYRVLTFHPEREPPTAVSPAALSPRGSLPQQFRAAGKVRLVDLGEVRAALGTRWTEVASRVMDTAEHIVRRMLRAGDVFSRTDEQAFLISFADTSEDEASFHAAMIEREIRTRLIGSAGSSTTVTAVVERDSYDGPSFAGLLEKRLDERRIEAEKKAREALEAVARDPVCAWEPVRTSAGPRLRAQIACLPAATERAIAAVATTLTAEQMGDFDIDALRLTAAVDALLAAPADEAMGLCFVPVDFDVFGQRTRQDRYLRLCNALPPSASQQLAFLLKNVSFETARSRALDSIQRLRPFCRTVGFILDSLAWPSLDPAGLSGAILAVDGEIAAPGGRPDASRVSALIERARINRLRVMVRRVEQPALADQLFLLGVDMITTAPPA